jgi:hypothetical protein
MTNTVKNIWDSVKNLVWVHVLLGYDLQSALTLQMQANIMVMSYSIHSRFSSEVPDVRSNQIQSTDPYRIRYDKLLHSYPVHITLNTAYFLHLVYPPFQYIGYAYFWVLLIRSLVINFRLMFDF